MHILPKNVKHETPVIAEVMMVQTIVDNKYIFL